MNACTVCNEQLTLHADGSITCVCEHVEYEPGRKDWPAAWETDGEYEETAQARELLMTAADGDSELLDYIHAAVDERDVMRQTHGDVDAALQLIRAGMAEYEVSA